MLSSIRNTSLVMFGRALPFALRCRGITSAAKVQPPPTQPEKVETAPSDNGNAALVYSHSLEDGVVKVKEVSDGATVKALGKAKLFAVVRVQGKQYLVSSGDVIMTDRMGRVKVGDKVPLTEVLLLGAEDVTMVGRPLLGPEVVTVESVVEEHTQTEKIHVFKKKRRKGYKRRFGHRSDVTVLRISSVTKKD